MKTELLLRIDRLARRLTTLSSLSQDSDITEFDGEDVSEIMAVQYEAASEIRRIVSKEIKDRSLK